MTNRKFLLVSMILALSFAGACSTVKLELRGNHQAVQKAQSIAYMGAIVAPPAMPTFPLIDAGIYRGAFNKHSPEVLALHNNAVETFDRNTAEMLGSMFHGHVVSGQELYASEQFRSALVSGVQSYAKILDDDIYGQLCIPSYAINVVDFTEVDCPREVISNGEGPHTANIARLAQSLRVDYVMYTVATVVTNGVSAFGGSGSRYLEVTAQVYDRNGRRVAHGIATSEATSARPSDIDHYGQVLGDYNFEMSRLIQAMFRTARPAQAFLTNENTAQLF